MQGLNEYLRFLVTLTAVVDPFLAVPFFLAFAGSRTPEERRVLARVVATAVFAVLAVSVVVGEALLLLIGASLPAFRVGGGLVLLLMALAMLNAQAGGVRQSQAEASQLQSGEAGGVVPLAIPLLAGPGAISTSIIAAEKGGAAHAAALIACIAPRWPCRPWPRDSRACSPRSRVRVWTGSRIQPGDGIDPVSYSLYSSRMSRPNRKGVEDARNQLPALLAEAERGRSTIITRHGRAVAAIVPMDLVKGEARQKSLLPLAGTGKGMWGRNSTKTLRKLRDEWER